MNKVLNNKQMLFTLSLYCVMVFLSCDKKPYVQGERIYNSQCANCHMENGQGLGTLIPPLATSDYYLDHYDNLVCIIKNGMSGRIVVNGISFDEEMPAARPMTEAEMSNLINYMNSEWYPEKAEINLKLIREFAENCEE